RLTSALDVLTAFIGHLISWMEELDNPKPNSKPSDSWLKMSPDLVLKLSSSIAETLSVTMEYLRDRWDASVAGARGLHPEARTGSAHTDFGSHKTLAWDVKDESAATDAFILSAIRAVALWVRDDDGDVLRKEGAGLMDMFMELYQSSGSDSSQPSGLDYRLPILAALEGVLRTSKGIEAFKSYEGWKILSGDMLRILDESSSSSALQEADVIRGTRIALVLQIVADNEGATPEDWMGVVTAVAAYDVPIVESGVRDQLLLDFQADVLQLVMTLLSNANPGMRRRYVHSAHAIRGIAEQLRGKVDGNRDTAKELEYVLSTLGE
ncbi:hypothetical protein PC116_g30674, partial [Phytophthora cactorum]